MADPFGDDFRTELGGVSAELDRIGDLADGVGRSLSRAFRGAVLDGKSLKSVLGEVASSFADIALKAAFQPIGNLVSGAIEIYFSNRQHRVTLAEVQRDKAAAAADTLMVVGHNPGLQELTVQLLQEADASPSLIARAQRNFPTATAAVFLFGHDGRPHYDALYFPDRHH